jgi:hypothetical protein
MNDENKEEPRLPDIIENFKLPLWAKLLIALPAIGLPVMILLFILRNDVAHDESRCPYEVLTTQRVDANTEVIEERRSCIEGVEDRRYSVRRPDSLRPLGVRRLPPDAFEVPAYKWTAELRQGQMFLKVVTKGHPDADFREGTEKERAYK